MKDTALEYLLKNPILHMCIIEPIRRNTAEILYSDKNTVFIKEQKSKLHMISSTNFEKGIQLIDSLEECNGIAVCQESMADYVFKKFKFTERFQCFQAAYMKKDRLIVKDDLEIREMSEDEVNIILRHYDKLSRKEIEELIKEGSLFGGYKDGVLVGFIGNHFEGSMGLLEVLPKYRCLGYGTILESFMVNKMLEKGLVPFAQIETFNKKSIALQRKLGFTISEEIMCWMF